MSESGLLRKDQLERSLHEEKKLIETGILKEDNPLDVSEGFRRLCEAARRGDMKVCQEMIQEGVNINAKDQYDYTPLILVSHCSLVKWSTSTISIMEDYPNDLSDRPVFADTMRLWNCF